MASILNKINEWYDLTHTYIVDVDEVTAVKRVLYEGIVTSIDVTADGTMTFYFTLSDGKTADKDASSLSIYESSEAYKAGSKARGKLYRSVVGLFKAMDVNANSIRIIPQNDGSIYIALDGYYIDEDGQVVKLDFPATLTFMREIGENGEPTPWESNAVFTKLAETDIYATREDALKNQQTVIKRFNGKEDEI